MTNCPEPRACHAIKPDSRAASGPPSSPTYIDVFLWSFPSQNPHKKQILSWNSVVSQNPTRHHMNENCTKAIFEDFPLRIHIKSAKSGKSRNFFGMWTFRRNFPVFRETSDEKNRWGRRTRSIATGWHRKKFPPACDAGANPLNLTST